MTRFLGSRAIAAVGALLLVVVAGPAPAMAQLPSTVQPPATPTTMPVAQPPAKPAPVVAATFDPRTQALLSAVARSAELSGPVYSQPYSTTPPAVNSAPWGAAPGAPGGAFAVTVHREVQAVGVAAIGQLAALVDANSVGDLDAETNCLATAVYFESKGEPLEGQLAVAQVVLNRAASGRYPASLCGVVKQHAQFSFVRSGAFPAINAGCEAWRKARAIARIASRRLVASLASDVLWYHADYVAPRWRQALVKVEQIGAHIFYRA